MLSGTTTTAVSLTARFLNPQGLSVVYSLVNNPNSNASISGSNLNLVGFFRGTTAYTVTVRATAGGSSADWSTSVTESTANPPTVVTSTIPRVDVYNTQARNTTNVSGYFTDPQSLPLSYTATVTAGGWNGTYSISGATLNVTGPGVNTSSQNITLSVTATNGRPGSAASAAASVMLLSLGNAPAMTVGSAIVTTPSLCAEPYFRWLHENINNWGSVGASMWITNGSVTLSGSQDFGKLAEWTYFPSCRNQTIQATVTAVDLLGRSITYTLNIVEIGEQTYMQTAAGNYRTTWLSPSLNWNLGRLSAGTFETFSNRITQELGRPNSYIIFRLRNGYSTAFWCYAPGEANGAMNRINMGSDRPYLEITSSTVNALSIINNGVQNLGSQKN